MSDIKSPILLFPDPLSSSGDITGAAFLYFDNPIVATPPAQVITKDAFELLRKVERKKPVWTEILHMLIGNWRIQQECFNRTIQLLGPLSEVGILKVVWMIYPATRNALEDAIALYEASPIENNELIKIINPFTASSELVRHIFLEIYLEFDKNIDCLYSYCNQLFSELSIESLLLSGYFLRLNILQKGSFNDSKLLLTNESLINVLSSYSDVGVNDTANSVDLDVIAYEFFRQILSPKLDPLNSNAVNLIAELRNGRNEEISRLRSKCMSLALDINQMKNYEQLIKNTSNMVTAKVETEVADLLRLDQTALRKFFEELFSEQATWAAFFAFIGGIIHGNGYITSAAVLGALSKIGSRAFKSEVERRRAIRDSDYALVYSIVNRKR
ncbi:MAG: hypothetical protein JXA96_11810 [Sedimentisphaerales bacterium]|nr:hypothetical protein [Sedimentisphaerales bacterium]